MAASNSSIVAGISRNSFSSSGVMAAIDSACLLASESCCLHSSTFFLQNSSWRDACWASFSCCFRLTSSSLIFASNSINAMCALENFHLHSTASTSTFLTSIAHWTR
uniref:Uncharacterized protein n=1 Tax=Rhizophora mucronata TaxID=61149 RepID=A0A2P2JKI9_RHIMU